MPMYQEWGGRERRENNNQAYELSHEDICNSYNQPWVENEDKFFESAPHIYSSKWCIVLQTDSYNL